MSADTTWVNGKRRQTGSWSYNQTSDTFTINLDSRDPVTGLQRVFTTHNDVPEWGNWKRLSAASAHPGPAIRANAKEAGALDEVSK